jgi:hypothetical protein
MLLLCVLLPGTGLCWGLCSNAHIPTPTSIKLSSLTHTRICDSKCAGVLLQQSEVVAASMCAGAWAWLVLVLDNAHTLTHCPSISPSSLPSCACTCTYELHMCANVVLQQSEVADGAAMCAAAGAWVVWGAVHPPHSLIISLSAASPSRLFHPRLLFPHLCRCAAAAVRGGRSCCYVCCCRGVACAG